MDSVKKEKERKHIKREETKTKGKRERSTGRRNDTSRSWWWYIRYRCNLDLQPNKPLERTKGREEQEQKEGVKVMDGNILNTLWHSMGCGEIQSSILRNLGSILQFFQAIRLDLKLAHDANAGAWNVNLCQRTEADAPKQSHGIPKWKDAADHT